jgi:hypothetical protein
MEVRFHRLAAQSIGMLGAGTSSVGKGLALISARKLIEPSGASRLNPIGRRASVIGFVALACDDSLMLFNIILPIRT